MALFSTIFTASTNTVSRLVTTEFGSTSAVQTVYDMIAGRGGLAVVNTGSMWSTMKHSGTIKNGSVNYSITNAATTISLQITGSFNLTATGISSGILEDVTTSWTVAPNDNILWYVSTSGATVACTINSTAVDYETTSGYATTFCSIQAGLAQTDNTTQYHGLGGSLVSNTTESVVQTQANAAFTFSNLRCMRSVSDTPAGTLYVYQNGGSSGLAVPSILANTTGLYENTTDTFTAAASDLLDFRVQTSSVSGTHYLNLTWIAIDMLGPAGGTTFTRTLSDTYTASEILKRPQLTRVKADTYSKSESMIKVATKYRNPAADTYSKSETLNKYAIKPRSLTDNNTTKSDTLVHKAVKVRTENNTAHSDTINKVATKIRTITDTYDKSESIVKYVQRLKTLSDTYSKSESIAKYVLRLKTLSDTYGKSESIIKKVTHLLTDTYSSKSESIQKFIIKLKTLSDTYGKSETLLKTVLHVKTDTSAGSGESLAAYRTFKRVLSDTKTASENIVIHLLRLKTLSDTYSKSEVLTKRATHVITDTYSKNESLVKSIQRLKTLSDTYGKSESIIKRVTHIITDTYSKSETLSSIAIRLRILSDTYGKSESLTGDRIAGIITRTLSDTYGATESIIKRVVKTLLESGVTSESIIIRKTATRAISDTYGANENLQKFAFFIRSILDIFGASESMQKSATKVRTQEDTYTANESLEGGKLGQTFLRTLEDTYDTVSDSIATIVTRVRIIVDNYSPGGGGAGYKQFIHYITETYTAAEFLAWNVIRAASQAAGSISGNKQVVQAVANSVRTIQQQRQQQQQQQQQRKQPTIIKPPEIQATKTVVRPLFDSYGASESINVIVHRTKIVEKTIVKIREVEQLKASEQLTRIAEREPDQLLTFISNYPDIETIQKLIVERQLNDEQITRIVSSESDKDRKEVKNRKLKQLQKLFNLVDLIKGLGGSSNNNK